MRSNRHRLSDHHLYWHFPLDCRITRGTSFILHIVSIVCVHFKICRHLSSQYAARCVIDSVCKTGKSIDDAHCNTNRLEVDLHISLFAFFLLSFPPPNAYRTSIDRSATQDRGLRRCNNGILNLNANFCGRLKKIRCSRRHPVIECMATVGDSKCTMRQWEVHRGCDDDKQRSLITSLIVLTFEIHYRRKTFACLTPIMSKCFNELAITVDYIKMTSTAINSIRKQCFGTWRDSELIRTGGCDDSV